MPTVVVLRPAFAKMDSMPAFDGADAGHHWQRRPAAKIAPYNNGLCGAVVSWRHPRS